MPKKLPFPKERCKQLFLLGLEEGLSLSGAADKAGIARITAWKWRKDDPAFDEACREAIEKGTDSLEDLLLSRAKEEKSRLALKALIMILQARRPDKWRSDRSPSVTNIQFVAELPKPAETTEEWIEGYAETVEAIDHAGNA